MAVANGENVRGRACSSQYQIANFCRLPAILLWLVGLAFQSNYFFSFSFLSFSLPLKNSQSCSWPLSRKKQLAFYIKPLPKKTYQKYTSSILRAYCINIKYTISILQIYYISCSILEVQFWKYTLSILLAEKVFLVYNQYTSNILHELWYI